VKSRCFANNSQPFVNAARKRGSRIVIVHYERFTKKRCYGAGRGEPKRRQRLNYGVISNTTPNPSEPPPLVVP
jgi:hypothetical protein